MKSTAKIKFLLVAAGLAVALGAGYWLGAGRHGQGSAPAASQAAPAAGERKAKFWKSPMDGTYVRDAPGKDYMGHDLVPVYEGDADESAAIAIDPVTIQNMGIRTAPVVRRDLTRTVRAVGLVAYDEQVRFSVNSKIDGWIERLYVNRTGQFVRKGQALMEIYSPELVAAFTHYPFAYASAVAQGNLFAVQFHPEKSQAAGLSLLGNFVAWDGAC